ncbi:MAG TPA: TIM barrel protein [Candidatus Nanoarchaeia archaeon]|nr:TIM barrel protein [Candidatus Nanoarchaeia archaeon]
MIRFGPAGLGGVKRALKTLEEYHSQGLQACEIAFTYGVYIKEEDTKNIRKKAQDLDIRLSIHAPYYINLNAADAGKLKASKERIIQCCAIGELLGAKTVVFHPGYYGEDREGAYTSIASSIRELVAEIKRRQYTIQLAPETMGKVNVFGGIDEVSRLVRDTGCGFCIDFAHILARDKKVDYTEVLRLFPGKEWHVHFSGIAYGEKGEKHHLTTETSAWKELLKHLPTEKEITIINESPTHVEDSVEGLKIAKKLGL